MRALIGIGFTCAFVGSVAAAEPEGCDKFKWPIENDRAVLTAPERTKAESGSQQTVSAKAITLALKPIESAALPMPPERKRASEGFAGFFQVAAPEKPASYTLSMSSAVWIDVIQGDRYLKPAAFSGATGCDGIRKTMRFELAAQPFTVQVSGSADSSVALLIRASE